MEHSLLCCRLETFGPRFETEGVARPGAACDIHARHCGRHRPAPPQQQRNRHGTARIPPLIRRARPVPVPTDRHGTPGAHGGRIGHAARGPLRRDRPLRGRRGGGAAGPPRRGLLPDIRAELPRQQRRLQGGPQGDRGRARLPPGPRGHEPHADAPLPLALLPQLLRHRLLEDRPGLRHGGRPSAPGAGPAQARDEDLPRRGGAIRDRGPRVAQGLAEQPELGVQQVRPLQRPGRHAARAGPLRHHGAPLLRRHKGGRSHGEHA